MERFIILFLAAMAAACASSTGAMKLGPDTYLVSALAAPARGGVSKAQQLALEEAQDFCGQQDLEILVTNISTGWSGISGGQADVTFRCLPPGDPELVRPTYEQPPDTVIEDRRD